MLLAVRPIEPCRIDADCVSARWVIKFGNRADVPGAPQQPGDPQVKTSPAAVTSPAGRLPPALHHLHRGWIPPAVLPPSVPLPLSTLPQPLNASFATSGGGFTESSSRVIEKVACLKSGTFPVLKSPPPAGEFERRPRNGSTKTAFYSPQPTDAEVTVWGFGQTEHLHMSGVRAEGTSKSSASAIQCLIQLLRYPQSLLFISGTYTIFPGKLVAL